MDGFLNLLVRRDEVKTWCLKLSLLLEDLAYGRLQIRSLVKLLATQEYLKVKVGGKILYRTKDGDRLRIIRRKDAGKEEAEEEETQAGLTQTCRRRKKGRDH